MPNPGPLAYYRQTGQMHQIASQVLTLLQLSDELENGARFDVIGHAAFGGPREDPQRVSQLRAENVVEALVLERVPRTRLRALGMGTREPVSVGQSEVEQAMNRRVVLKIRFGESNGRTHR